MKKLTLFLVVLFVGLDASAQINITQSPYHANPLKNNSDDDGAIIQAAIDDCGASGCEIIIPDGTFEINTPLKLNDNIKLSLSPGAILVSDDVGGNCGLEEGLIDIIGKKNIVISGGEFRGSYPYSWEGKVWVDNQTQVTDNRYGGQDYCGNNYGIKIVESENVTIEDAVFLKFRGDAILASGSTPASGTLPSEKIIIRDNSFYSIIDNAVAIGWLNSKVKITGNTISDLDGDGMVISGNEVIIKDNIITNIGLNGHGELGNLGGSGIALSPDIPNENRPAVFLMSPYNSADNIVIIDNIISHVYGFGISNDNSQYVIIESNIISDITWSNGIKFGCITAPESIIANNIVKDVYDQSSIDVDTDWVLINDNWITNKQGIDRLETELITGSCNQPAIHKVKEDNGLNPARTPAE